MNIVHENRKECSHHDNTRPKLSCNNNRLMDLKLVLQLTLYVKTCEQMFKPIELGSWGVGTLQLTFHYNE